MRLGGIAAAALMALALGPAAAQPAEPAIRPSLCAAATVSARLHKPNAPLDGDAYARLQAWRALAIDEPDGLARLVEATAILAKDPAAAEAQAAHCAGIDPMTLTPPMPDNPGGDYKACGVRQTEAMDIALPALKDYQANRDAGALCRQLAQADALLMAEREEMASGKSRCDMPQVAWIEAGDLALTYRMMLAATVAATAKGCSDFEGKRSASL